MPATISVALIVLGAVLILVAVLGGKFEIFGAEVEGTTSKWGRILALVLGLIFVVVAIVLDLRPAPASPDQIAGQPQPVSSSDATPTPADLPAPADNTVLQPVAPSADTSCPAVPGLASLTPNQWVGPLTTSDGASYDIAYDPSNIYVWDNNAGKSSTYNNPAAQGALSQWDSISGLPIQICEDASSNFYAAISQ